MRIPSRHLSIPPSRDMGLVKVDRSPSLQAVRGADLMDRLLGTVLPWCSASDPELRIRLHRCREPSSGRTPCSEQRRDTNPHHGHAAVFLHIGIRNAGTFLPRRQECRWHVPHIPNNERGDNREQYGKIVYWGHMRIYLYTFILRGLHRVCNRLKNNCSLTGFPALLVLIHGSEEL